MIKYQSTKLYDGFSACFRQWKAEGTHCKYLHAYELSFQLNFDRDIMDIFKKYPEFDTYLEKWFNDTFRYKTFIAEDDPYLNKFKELNNLNIIQLTILPQVGCERFAEFIFNNINTIINHFGIDLELISTEVFEHEKNSALILS